MGGVPDNQHSVSLLEMERMMRELRRRLDRLESDSLSPVPRTYDAEFARAEMDEGDG